MTPEQAFDKTLQKWKKVAAGKWDFSDGYWPHEDTIECGFCQFTDAIDQLAARAVVALLEKHKDDLIAAGHAILKEVENG